MVGKKIGHYSIDQFLGEGGMGVVYRALDSRLGRAVAIKFLDRSSGKSDDNQARFLREAKTAASLNHPNICTVYDFDVFECDRFIVMEYVEGMSVKQKLDGQPLSLNEAFDIANDTAKGLQAANAANVIHRDIKSSNIILTADNRVKVMDFGLAKFSGQSDLTTSGTALGTPAYMSPEQATGKNLDARTDIWSLGVVLYEMVTGLLPFRNEYTQAVLYSLLNEEPAPPTSVRTGLPVSLDQVIRKALAKERERRYQHLDDFLVDLTGLREMRRTVNTGSVRGINSDRSIAVLPFANMNRDEESEFFSGGITEDINSLSAIPRLRVSSRNASFGYKGMRYGLREVSEKLNVEKVLEGSVRRVAQQVRITAELVDARDDTQLWAERYDRNIEDVFAIQDEIAQSIVSTLRIKLDADLSRPE